MFTPSKYQSAIFSFIETGSGHAVVDAVPGSGKTTTLLEGAKRLPASAKALFCAFNAHIAKELGEKLKASGSSMECSTIHSLGKRILKPGTRLEERKYNQLAKDYLMEQTIRTGKLVATRELIGQLKKLVDFARLTLVEPNERELTRIISHYDIEIDAEEWRTILDGVAPILEEGKRMYELGSIDFTDMIWLPVALKMACPQYEYLFVDECQDLNACQLALVMLCCRRGRMVFVGDKRQSLYGFAGADTHSIKHIIEQTEATVLPLSICYRCPTDVVDLARKIFVGIEAAEGKERGQIDVIAPDRFAATVQLGDLVLCRCTAPLVSQCLKLLRAGVKAQVRGKDIGKSFIDLINAVRFYMGFSLETLGKLAEDYRWQQLKVLENVPDNEMKVANLNDKVDTFHALYEAYLNKAQGAGSIPGFESYLQDFFTDDLGNGSKPVMFSTVHKAKGLEYDRVFILEPGLLPHPAAKKDWQREQEYNIEYVAVTRAKQTLIFVDGMPANLQQEPEAAITPEQEQLALAMEQMLAHCDNNAVQTVKESLQAIAEPERLVVKVKIWGKYRRSQVLRVEGERVTVRILASELVQGLTDVHTVELVQVRKADLQLIGQFNRKQPEPAQNVQPELELYAGYPVRTEGEIPEDIRQMWQEQEAEPAQSIMTACENVAPTTSWVQPPKAHVAVKVGRTPRTDPRGRKIRGTEKRVTLQLSIDPEVYARVMALKAAGEIESASALFETLFSKEYN